LTIPDFFPSPVSRKANLHGTDYIELKGKSIIYPQVTIRGELGTSAIRVGRYVSIGKGTIIRPAFYLSTPDEENGLSVHFMQSLIGPHTQIGTECIIESASIGASVHIGNNCILSKRCMIKDCCVVLDDTVIPPDMVIPPFSFVSGVPARIHAHKFLENDCSSKHAYLSIAGGETVPESAATDFVEQSLESFNHFVLSMDSQISN